MLKNYIKTAFRNLTRQRSSAFFNIGGLTLAISSTIVLFQLVSHVLSYDTFHTRFDRIYRVVTQSEGNEEMFYTPGIPTALPTAFRNDFPEVEHVIFTRYEYGGLVSIPQRDGNAKKYQEERGIVYTEPTFFQTFDRPVLSGDATKGLDEPNEAIISRELAVKYFGREDAIGEVLNYENVDYKISAIVENVPNNTDFPFSLFLSYETVRKASEERGWKGISSNDQCYFLLKDGVDISQVEKRMATFTEKYIGKENYDKELFNIQPLNDLHFNEQYYSYSENGMSRSRIMAIVFIGLILIITGCINFINLSTAEAIKRSKEVGIRKSLGSTRGQLIFQFLGETALVTFISIVISIGVAQLALGYLNSFIDMELTLNLLKDTSLLIFLVFLFVAVSVFAGIYPAFIMSGFTPALVMKNDTSNRSSIGYFMRKGLVVFQFSISQFLIIGTIIIITQTNFLQSQNLGFRQDAIITLSLPEQELPTPDSAGHSSKMRTLKNEVSRLAGVESVSLCNAAPSSGHVSGTGFILEGERDEQRKDTQVKTVDGNYIDLFELKLLSGERLVDLDTATGYVVNREFARIAGFADPTEIVGKRVRIWRKLYPVIGVVENFHTTSLHDKIEPTVLLNRIANYYTMAVRINPKNFQASIADIQKQWENAYPKYIFSYEFLDENIREFYENEQEWSVLLTVFTSISILIGCIGLFGLATFVANQKTKEIGVRKVLGASVTSIVMMFSKEFVLLIFIGFALAAPFAWLVMSSYLSDFEYRIELGPGIFLFGLALTLLIAVLTVGYRSFKAAVINPVKALRYE